MELVNATRMAAAYTMGMEPSGRELLVVVVKGTFSIPNDSEPVRLAEEQVPLVMADTFTGEAGLSAPIHEMDFPPLKRRCDVLLIGSAYAPGSRPTTRVSVTIRVGQMTKSFTVIGNRHWRSGISGISASSPDPFTVMPISYDNAFGGIDNRHEDPTKHVAFTRNPVGRGFHRHLRSEWLEGSALPNTEELDRPIERPDSMEYVPMAFGPVGRGWEPRYKYAGTYDDTWLDEHFPFLPPDFNELYYQAAPADQQLPHPQGGEEIRLTGFSPNGDVTFRLPIFDAPIHFFPKRGKREDGNLILDTIVFDPDKNKYMLTWRATRVVKRSMFEVAQIVVGKKSQSWWAERESLTQPIKLRLIAAGPEDVGPGGSTERSQ